MVLLTPVPLGRRRRRGPRSQCQKGEEEGEASRTPHMLRSKYFIPSIHLIPSANTPKCGGRGHIAADYAKIKAAEEEADAEKAAAAGGTTGRQRQRRYRASRHRRYRRAAR